MQHTASMLEHKGRRRQRHRRTWHMAVNCCCCADMVPREPPVALNSSLHTARSVSMSTAAPAPAWKQLWYILANCGSL